METTNELMGNPPIDRKLLIFLYENYVSGHFLNLHDFLYSTFDIKSVEDAKTAERILKEQRKRDYVEFRIEKNNQNVCNLGDDWKNERPPGNIENHTFHAKLTLPGREYISNEIRQEKQEKVTLQKLNLEIDDLVNRLVDYPTVKKRANDNWKLTLILAIVSIGSLFVSIRSCQVAKSSQKSEISTFHSHSLSLR